MLETPDKNQPVAVTCSITGETKEVEPIKDGSPSLPRGWRRLGDGRIVSSTAWTTNWSPRAVRIPIASVHVEGSTDPTAGWKDFRQAYYAAESSATAYANAAQFRFALLDSALPLIKTEKGFALPKIERETRNAWLREVYALGANYPALDSQVVAAIRNDTLSDYSALRWKLRITHQAVRQGYKQGYPIPFPAASVKLIQDPGNGWISFRIRLGGTPFWVRLSGSHKFSHALQSLRRVRQDAELGQISLSERTVFGDNANRDQQVKQQKQIVLTAIVYLPIQAREVDAARVMHVICGGQETPLLSCRIGDNERTWDLHASDLFAGLMHAKAQRQKLSTDRKFERRVAPDKIAFERHSSAATERRRRWIDDRLHKVSRELVNFAVRTKCGTIRYDDSASKLGPRFKLLTLVEQKCRESGIILLANSPKSSVEHAAGA